MMWVKETFPPRPRARWLLMTTRLSKRSFTGSERTLVAVGTVRLSSMLVTTRAAPPLSRSILSDEEFAVTDVVDVDDSVAFAEAADGATASGTIAVGIGVLGVITACGSCGVKPSKKSHQAGSTEVRSLRNC